MLRAVLLGGYATKRGAGATHTSWTVPPVDWQPDPAVGMRMDQRRAFEEEVVAALLSTAPDAVDLRPYEQEMRAHVTRHGGTSGAAPA